MAASVSSFAFRFAKFVGSGGVATIVHTSVMFGLLQLGLGPHQSFLGGFTSGVVARFFIDRNLVFEATGEAARIQFLRYGAACVGAYVASGGLFYIFLDILGWHELPAFVAAVVLTTLIAYVLIAIALRDFRKKIA